MVVAVVVVVGVVVVVVEIVSIVVIVVVAVVVVVVLWQAQRLEQAGATADTRDGTCGCAPPDFSRG